MLVLAIITKAVASAVPSPTVIPAPSALPLVAPIDPVLNGWAKIIVEIMWPLVVLLIVALAIYRLMPLIVPLVSDYVALLNQQHALRREQQARLSRASWDYSDSVNVTETVATAVAAAVAVRLIKQPEVEATPNFELLRSIVRRMTQSINSGETHALHGKQILWVHQKDIEDALEKHVFENLGASVRFFTDNVSVMKHAKEDRYRDDIVAIISNRNHWDTAANCDAAKPVDPEAALSLLRDLKKDTALSDFPVIIYSRSLDPAYEGRLTNAGAELCTSLPDVLIHHILETTNTRERRGDYTTTPRTKQRARVGRHVPQARGRG